MPWMMTTFILSSDTLLNRTRQIGRKATRHDTRVSQTGRDFSAVGQPRFHPLQAFEAKARLIMRLVILVNQGMDDLNY